MSKVSTCSRSLGNFLSLGGVGSIMGEVVGGATGIDVGLKAEVESVLFRTLRWLPIGWASLV